MAAMVATSISRDYEMKRGEKRREEENLHERTEGRTEDGRTSFP